MCIVSGMELPTTPSTPAKWNSVVRAQGRTLRWLAIETGKSPRTVYAYSQGKLIPTQQWLADASRVLGQEVAA